MSPRYYVCNFQCFQASNLPLCCFRQIFPGFHIPWFLQFPGSVFPGSYVLYFTCVLYPLFPWCYVLDTDPQGRVSYFSTLCFCGLMLTCSGSIVFRVLQVSTVYPENPVTNIPFCDQTALCSWGHALPLMTFSKDQQDDPRPFCFHISVFGQYTV